MTVTTFKALHMESEQSQVCPYARDLHNSDEFYTFRLKMIWLLTPPYTTNVYWSPQWQSWWCMA